MTVYKNFISFEGIDYCGKSTQIKILLEHLKKFKANVIVLREPGGTPISEKIRHILLDKENVKMLPQTEILLYSAARAQLVHEKIIPALERGDFVIADRFFDSTTAYQGFGRNLDIKLVEQLNRFATSQLKPFKTFFLDIPPGEVEKRRHSRNKDKDRMESEGAEFYQRIREGFLKLVQQEPQRFIFLDALRPEEEIAGEIWQYIEEFWIFNRGE